ncbi:unnamed protein product [Meganyctiphanes norvegica]|uniref:STAS domain-containing protein n=1 Tax=Meganyctiphanes norvegica TaxID=48144 RepID=A0AAV2SUG6_MEGNR
MCALINIFDYQIIQNLWRSTRRELIPYLITFICCSFLGLSTGILIGIAVNLSILLFSIAKPNITVSSDVFSKEEHRYVQVQIPQSVQYPSSSHIQSSVSKAGIREACGFDPVVVDCSQLKQLDYTAARGLVNLSSEFKQRRQPLVFLGLSPAILNNVGSLLTDLTLCAEEDNLYETILESRIKEDEDASVKCIDVTTHTTSSIENGGTSKPLLVRRSNKLSPA